ncbi:unnamed protein product [Schistosoma turkestanicum]|nr:unnamed protein product [Schistosoma turkestanicum]
MTAYINSILTTRLHRAVLQCDCCVFREKMLSSLIVILLVLFPCYCNKVKRSFTVDYSNHVFMKDDAPFQYVSGSIHYFRIPQEYWPDRLFKMKAAGLDAIQIYIPWNFHQPESDIFNFHGDRSLQRFLELASSLDLLVIARVGPYICAEWDFGGLPPWLLRINPLMKLRSSDPEYMNYVTKWFDVLLPIIKHFLYENGGPIIMVQLLLNDIRKSRVSRNNVHFDLPNLTDYDIGQGYGIDQVSAQAKQKLADVSVSNQNAENTSNESTISNNLSANQLLLRRFNNHSILVLKSLNSSDASSSTNNSSQNSKDVLNSCPLKDHVYVKELVEDQNPPEIQLDLTCINDYLEGPTPSITEKATKLVDPLSVTRQTDTSFYGLQVEQSVNKCKNSMISAYHMGKKPGVSLLTALESQQALADVSPGGCLIGGKLNNERSKTCDLTSESVRSSHISNSPKASDEHHSGDDVDRGPPLLTLEQGKDLSLLYSSAAELLRHFWACFPVTTPQLADKLDRVAASLNRFRTTKVAHFAASVDPSFRNKSDTYSANSSEHLSNSGNSGSISYRSSVTSHLESMLDSAQKKYSEWKTRHSQ